MKYWRAVVVAVLPLVAYLVPEGWIMQGHSICLVHNLFGVECWGCGMTRALYSLMHLRFADAWHLNRAVVIVAPLLAYVWIKWVVRLVKTIKTK